MKTADKIVLFKSACEKIPPNIQRHAEKIQDCFAMADKIVDGFVYFNNIQEVQVGLKEIDWLGDHLNHQEWRAQLNRFFSIAPLVYAWQATADEKYPLRARVLIDDWIDFMQGHEAEMMHEKDNSLNLSIRIGSGMFAGWAAALYYFTDSVHFDEPFFEKVTASIERQVKYLMKTGLPPVGNWRIAVLDALIHTAIRLPWMTGSKDILTVAGRKMRNALTRQFNADGSHIELTPNYHFWMSKVLHHYYMLAREIPKLDMNIRPESVAKALHLCALYERFPVNDSHPVYNEKVCHDAEAKKIPALLDKAELHKYFNPAQNLYCPESGYIFASDNATELFFDASHWAGSHTHCSRLQVCINSGSKPLIIDPGIMSYEMSNPYMAYGKSTSAHSTININGLNQSPSAAKIDLYDATDSVVFSEAVYTGGYWTGQNSWGFRDGVGQGVYVKHTRAVFFLKNEYILVLDAVPGEPGMIINNCWQAAPFDDYVCDRKNLSFISMDATGANILLQMILPPAGDVTMQTFCGRKPPEPRGWAGVPGQTVIPAPLIEFSYPGGVPSGGLSAVLLAPFTSEKPEFKLKKTGGTNCIMYFELSTPNGYTDCISWAPGGEIPVDEGSPQITDASFSYARLDNAGNMLAVYTPNGSCLDK